MKILYILINLLFSLLFSFSLSSQSILFNENFEGILQVTPTGIPVWSINNNLQVSGTNSYHNAVAINTTTYFETPALNLTGFPNVFLEFSHICKIEINDSARIFISVDDGVNWQVLPQNTYLGTGLYFINNMEGFCSGSYIVTWLTGNHAAIPTNSWWKNEKFDVSSIAANQSQVKFRFYLKDGNGTGANQNAGWFIDDIKVTLSQISNDAGVVEIVAPVGQALSGVPNQVTVKLKNFGTQTLTTIPVSYSILGGPPQVDMIWTGILAPGAETNYTFPTTFIGPLNDFSLCSWTSLTGDIYMFNDSACAQLTPGSANVDGAVTEILEPDSLTVAGTNVTVTIRVKNLGTQPLEDIPVHYLIDSTLISSETVIGTLNPGYEVDYTFLTTFVSPSNDYELCAKTSIVGDAIISNDQICKDLTTNITNTELNSIKLLQNKPNPAHDETVIGFSLPSGCKLTLTITNILGEVIYTETGEYVAGLHYVSVNTRNIGVGVYSYSITFDQQKLTRKMVIQ